MYILLGILRMFQLKKCLKLRFSFLPFYSNFFLNVTKIVAKIILGQYDNELARNAILVSKLYKGVKKYVIAIICNSL